MKKEFTEIKPDQITDNTFKLIGADWMLITAGSINNYNTMTANWGGLGFFWNKNVAICVVRPSRYTYEFMEGTDVFTLSFFTDDYREALNYCGFYSGRDVNKASETGLTAVESDNGAVYFSQARLVMECKKIYYQDLEPKNFLDQDICRKWYADNDYHRMYLGEIIKILSR